ncbi:hypothetical protein [Petrocella sp. FN5]|uniref:hypothetical protein n=1 Tax=Petrocella sp. FN5 TaxID=3032002 RepID=UPI0023DC9D9C|nr:hypothetical protein [Petrocella sp. FN5]MDF1616893.1 hypothetical protein [Petrocella sp. FN5]
MMLKTILDQKFKYSKIQKEKSKVIAVTGVARGIGVTHFCIMMAYYLAKQRRKVALVELNDTGHFGKIEKAYEGLHHDIMSTESFNIKGVTYYKGTSKEKLMDLYQADYHYILLDIGEGIKNYAEEHKRADIPLVIGHVSDWKIDEVDDFRIRYSMLMTKRCKWLFPDGKKDELLELGRKIGMTFHTIPYCVDPFVRKKVTQDHMKRIIGLEV